MALATYTKHSIDAEVIWRPYMLRPNHPIEGVAKPADSPSNPRVGAHLKNAGIAVGIDFTGRCDRTPNTLLAHQLLEYTLEKYSTGKQNEVNEALFHAYFTDGIFLSEENLVSIASSCGLDRNEVSTVMADNDSLSKLMSVIQRNVRFVRHGVPFFAFNGQPAFSGAQDPSAFHQVFDMLHSE